MDTAATLVVGAVALYAATGLAVGTAFIVFGIDRVLEPPADVSLGARVLILPGAAALWPYVLKRWASSGRGS
jgi:hypothetical protein